MSQKQAEAAAQQERTPEEAERYMNEPLTRSELAEVWPALVARDVLPEIDSKFGFVINLMRLMFEASGAMTHDEFNRVYQELVDAFTEKYGQGEEEQEPSKH